MNDLIVKMKAHLPGVAAATVVGVAATFLSEHYSAPVMLYALLLGIALNFLADTEEAKPGVEFSARTLLRIGVVLLGLRIGWSDVSSLGFELIGMLCLSVALTIGVSILLARAMGFNPLFGLLSGGATAICGASAAMALSAALPPHEKKEQATIFTVIGVSALSTLAMILYPLIANLLGFDHQSAGIFIGATIHDVAQVVGAGYAISPETGNVATVVKLLRVAMLLPVILLATHLGRQQAQGEGERPPLLPWFVVGFVIAAAINSLAILPKAVTDFGSDLSRWCLVISMTAIGMKTRLGELRKVGIRPVILMVIETIFLALLVIGWVTYLR